MGKSTVGKSKPFRSKHSKANRQLFEELVYKWASILLLDSYSIWISFEEKDNDDGVSADVITNLAYKRISIAVYPGLWGDIIPVESVVRHELLHAVVAPLSNLVDYDQEDENLKTLYVRQHESTVEHINNIIERLHEV
jgi:hypothetical protein